MTRPATLNNNNDETPSPCAIDVVTNPQLYLHQTDGNQLVMGDVEQEEDEEGNDDSMCDAEEIKCLEDALEESLRDHLETLLNQDQVEEAAIDCESDKFVLKKEGLQHRYCFRKCPMTGNPKVSYLKKINQSGRTLITQGNGPSSHSDPSSTQGLRECTVTLHFLLEQGPFLRMLLPE
jgi:hypothetical protein